jgi:hypothetical protein
VNLSDEDVVDVPLGVVTVMSTVPVGSAGEVAVIFVEELMVKLAAATLPNITCVAPVKFVPLITTLVPPAVAARRGTGSGGGEAAKRGMRDAEAWMDQC